jgi:hypothetical protein
MLLWVQGLPAARLVQESVDAVSRTRASVVLPLVASRAPALRALRRLIEEAARLVLLLVLLLMLLLTMLLLMLPGARRLAAALLAMLAPVDGVSATPVVPVRLPHLVGAEGPMPGDEALKTPPFEMGVKTEGPDAPAPTLRSSGLPPVGPGLSTWSTPRGGVLCLSMKLLMSGPVLPVLGWEAGQSGVTATVGELGAITGDSGMQINACSKKCTCKAVLCQRWSSVLRL